jgi:hypothetical protein
MIRKTLAAAALAGLCTFGAAGVAAAETVPPQPSEPQWVAVFYFGPQSYCLQAGALGQQTGALTAGQWTCDSGWLMVLAPQQG